MIYKNKRHSILAIVLCCTVLFLSGCLTTNSVPQSSTSLPSSDSSVKLQDDAIVIKLATPINSSSPLYPALEAFEEQVERESDGAMDVQLYPAGQLGTQTEVIEGMSMGTVEMGHFSVGGTESFFPQIALLITMFGYESEEHASAVYDSEWAQEIFDEQAQAINIRMLAEDYTGFRHIWTTEKIETLDDLHGLKIRTPDSPLFITVFETIGANPTPMSMSEIYTGLQTKVIDGFELPTSEVYAQKYFEVAKYCLKTGHSLEITGFHIAEDFFQSLPQEYRDIIQTAADDCAELAKQAYFEDLEHVESLLTENGVVFVEPSQEMMEEIRTLLEPVTLDYIGDYGTIEDLEFKASLAPSQSAS